MAGSFRSSPWRQLLTAGAAGAALAIGGGGAARAGCVDSGTTRDCTGDLQAGVDAGDPLTTLNVFGLTTDIAPGVTVPGVYFLSNGPITVNVDTGPWRIVTNGPGANGIAAATLGNGAVSITASGSIRTSGTFATGIIGQSGGGDLTIRSFASIATTGALTDIGASGIIGESGTGNVDIFSAGNIQTTQPLSYGIYAGTQGDIRVVSLGDITASGDSSPGIYAFGMGQGDVFIEAAGNITTAGEDAAGIYAETDGAAMVFSYGSIVTTGDRAAGIDVASENGAVVISTSNIRTFGDDAPGITVLSDGDAGVASSGNITTTGGASDGINVVSTNGMAAVVNSGDISATGAGSAGIYAASYAGTSVINFGAITGCPCGGVILRTFDGDNNLVNFGWIIADLNGSAIEMDTVSAGANLVENFGTVTGNVLMAGVAGSAFANRAGAFFNPGDAIIGDVINDGTIAPGGQGSIMSTSLAGQFVQGATGILAIDVDGASGTSDQVGVTGSAQLAGNVAVHLTSVPLTAAQTFLILTADDGVTNDGLRLTASPALHATLTYPNANDVVLGIAVDFDVSGLNGNQRAITRDLGEIFLAGGGGVSPVLLGLLNTGDLAEYRSALDQLSPAIYSDAQIAALYSSLAFSNSLLSCKVSGTDTPSIIREGQCLWAGASARFLDAGTTSQQIGFTEDAGLFTAGAQVALDDVWRLGAAAGYQSSTIDTATGATSSGALGQAGLAVKYNPGPLLLAAAISGGGGQYDTHRPMSFGGFSGIADGTQDLGVFAGTFRAAYVFGSPSLYFKPTIDAALTRLQLSGFTEEGGNGAALTAEGQGQTVFSLAPTLETGTEWWLGNGTLVRPLIRAGAVWYDNADLALTASFAEAPLGVAPFTIHTNVDDVMGVAGAGVDVISRSGAVLRFSYDGQFGETTQIHAVGIKGSAKF